MSNHGCQEDPSGRRSVEAEVKVPGTAEEVWQAIATGPGISSWFVPTTVEEPVDGTATANFGPGNLLHYVGTVDLKANTLTLLTERPNPAAPGKTCHKVLTSSMRKSRVAEVS